MKVYVVIEMTEGLISDPVVYLRQQDAENHFNKCLEENHIPNAAEPYNDCYEVYWYETEIIKPRMVLAGHRRAMARLEALCS
jgi:hypothetical protein